MRCSEPAGSPPGQSIRDDYERGYLCGIVRGDGTLGAYSYERADRTSPSVVHRFRLALADDEALVRAERYLLARGVRTTAFSFLAASGAHRPMRAIRTQARSQCDRVRELIRWPLSPSDEWRKGFLAGIFDAEGSGDGVIRISNEDETILRWIQSCMDTFGLGPCWRDRTRSAYGSSDCAAGCASGCASFISSTRRSGASWTSTAWP